MNMNSKYLTILPAVAAALLLAACSSDDMDGPGNTDSLLADGPVPAQVTADISNGQTVTRISTDGDAASFATDDVIYVVADGSEAYEYTLQSDGSWSAVSSPYYFQDRNSVSFRGWYADPETSATETENSISINTAGQTINDNGWNQWDILVTPEVSASALSSAVNFTDDDAFCHIMSKVTLTFSTGAGVSGLSALTGYTMKNLTTEASFNTLSCTLTAGSSTGEIAQTVSGASGSEFTCTPIILVPQDVTDSTPLLEVSYNGVIYTTELTMPDGVTALAEGMHYMFSVTISNTGLKIDSAEIKGWTTDTQEDSVSFKDYFVTTDDDGKTTYIVYSEAGLQAWGEYTRSGNWSTNCFLAEDIFMSSVASGESNWTTVGTSSSKSYAGSFDGNGKTITGLTMNATSQYQGLIGYMGSKGEVKDLTLREVNISSTLHYTGGVVGYSRGTVTACYITGSVSGTYYVGGVVGYNRGTLSGCSFVSGKVSGTSATGGVTGYNHSRSTVSGCSFVSGEVSGNQDSGGVVGTNNSSGSVIACYATGATTVSGNQDTGGVVGMNNSSGAVTACYATGSVSGSNFTGGVTGFNNSGSVSSCFWNNEASKGIGYGSGETTYVDGTEVTWADAASTMNIALTEAGYDWQYAENSNDSEVPLILAEE